MYKSSLFITIVLGLLVGCISTIIIPISYGQSTFGSDSDSSLNSLLGNNQWSYGDNKNTKSDETRLIDFTVNETSGLKTHVNPFYKFSIQYPLEWKEEELSTDLAFLGSKEVFRIGDASNNPNPMRTSSNIVVTIDIEPTSQSLNPDSLQVESATAEDYANNQIAILSEPMDFGSMQATHDITKNAATTVSNQSAWRIEYITNLAGVQSSYQSEIYVVNTGTLYKISLFTDPLEVPTMLPIFDQIIGSFRFLNDSSLTNIIDESVSIKLNSAEFLITESSRHQAKILVDYETKDIDTIGNKINGVLEITDLDGNKIKTSTFPDGFSITESGIIQFASSVDDDSIDTVNLRVYLTDLSGVKGISNIINTTVSLYETQDEDDEGNNDQDDDNSEDEDNN